MFQINCENNVEYFSKFTRIAEFHINFELKIKTKKKHNSNQNENRKANVVLDLKL